MAAEYTLIIGTRNYSSWSLRGYLAMRAANTPFEEIVVRLYQPETKAELLKHSPAGKVPVLKIYEHKHIAAVWDSLAICETMAERHPEAHLWPVNPTKRQQARSYAAEMHSSYAGLRSELPMDFARTLPMPKQSAATQADIARIVDAWLAALTENAAIGPYLFGAYSIADIMYAPVVSRFLTYDVPVPDAIRAYCRQIMSLPAMQDWATAAKTEIETGLA